MNSGVKLLVLLLCVVSIGGLFLPQMTISSEFSDDKESTIYIQVGEEAEDKDQSMGITILVLIAIAVFFLCIGANVLSLLALTAGGTLVVYNAVILIKAMDIYKEYSDSLSGFMDMNYGIGFYMLPAGILISIIMILFNLNNQNDVGYASGISYSSLSSRTSYQPSSYNPEPQPVVQPNYNQYYGQSAANSSYQSIGMQNSSVNTNIFNQAPVASNVNQFDAVVDNAGQNTSVTSSAMNCPQCGSSLNSGMQFCNNCGTKIN